MVNIKFNSGFSYTQHVNRQMRSVKYDKIQSYNTIHGEYQLFYILLTVHLGTLLANNQLDALFLMYLFISPLYKFRAAQCSSSGQRLY